MNVLYDISGLGGLRLRSAPLTGVPRVIENVARGLAAAADPACHVTTCSITAPYVDRLYFQQHLAKTGLNFAPADTSVAGRCAGEAHRQLQRSLSRRAWPWRVLRGLSFPVVQRADAYFGRLPPEVIRAADIYHSPHDAIPDRVRASVRRGRPQAALTVYDLIPFKHPEFFLPGMAEAQRTIIRTTRPREDWYLCISESTKNDLCEVFSVDPARVFVTLLAADAQVFHPCPTDVSAEVARRYGIPSGPYVMSLCTLEPRKNVRTLIESFAHIVPSREVPDLHLVLVGGKGWLDADLQEILARRPEVRQRIILPGFVPDEDLAPLFSGALCFAYLSLYEGFGLPPLEAMQCGVPVIVANTSSLREVVGDSALIFAPRDSEGVAQAIIDLARDPTRRTALGAKSLARAQTFSWTKCAHDTIAAYQVMLAAGRP